MPTKSKSSSQSAAAQPDPVCEVDGVANEAGQPPATHTPRWEIWKTRPSATLSEALKLTLNISTIRGSLQALRKAKDPRVKGFKLHLRTLKKWARVGNKGLVRVEPSQALSESSEFHLAPFIEWLRHESPFPEVTPPDKLLDLNPANAQTAVADGSADARLAVLESAVPVVPDLDSIAVTPNSHGQKTRAEVRSSTSTWAADDATLRSEPLANSGALPARGAMTIGLLLMYIRYLAQSTKPPPRALLQGSLKKMNASALADELNQFLSERTDQVDPKALKTAGASPRTLRQCLGEGAKYFGNDLSEE